jgi:hypothetical protein
VIVAGIELAMVARVIALGAVALRESFFVIVPALFVIAFLGVGALVAYRRPTQPMGWMLLGVSGFLLFSGIGGSYSILVYTRHHGDLPLGPLAVMLDPSWAPAITLLVLCILLYPEGKLPSSRWRWPLRWLVFVALAWQVGAYVIAATTLLTSTIRLDSGGDLQQINNPSGIWAWWGIVQILFFITVAALVLAWVVGQVRGYRRLTGERRVQQKWLLAGATLAVASMILLTPSAIAPHPGSIVTALGNLAPLGLAALPITIGIGILKYRLYEIDRIVSRTVSYAILTVLLVGTFVGLVALTTQLLPFSSSIGVAASTLAAAALFNPLRMKIQHAVDRRFNRARYDAEATVEAFAQRLRDAVDLDAIQADLLNTVQRSVEPAHATVWIRQSSPLDQAPDARVERVSL